MINKDDTREVIIFKLAIFASAIVPTLIAVMLGAGQNCIFFGIFGLMTTFFGIGFYLKKQRQKAAKLEAENVE